ncbi:MAG: hypothetical protein IJH07_00975 [Ruminococcus sp.]|nr:hypothetical protein [Ruminococcus sp.]
MWINEYVSGRSFGVNTATAVEIRAANNGSVAVSSTRDFSELPVIAPAGIVYVPVTGSPTMVMEGAGGAVCLGVIAAPPSSLEAGELMLHSAGGASIVLKNDGRVLINGREVS